MVYNLNITSNYLYSRLSIFVVSNMFRLIRSLDNVGATRYQRVFSSSKSSSSSSSSSSSDDESKKRTPVVKSARTAASLEARAKLASLLNDMTNADLSNKQPSNLPKLDLAKATSKRSKDRPKQFSDDKNQPLEKRVEKAAKEVAAVIGGDTKRTESELLQRLRSASVPKSDETDASTPVTAKNLSNLFKDMKIDRESAARPTGTPTRGEHVKNLLKAVETYSGRGKEDGTRRRSPTSKERPRFDEPLETVDLFGSGSLGVFPSREEVASWSAKCCNATWQRLHERELELAVTHPPANYFQQMILWTEQGKLWHFPIDNEQGMVEERDVYFADHVFVERYIEDWCPQKGPIRHFMELVCVGLSKNHCLTVQRKKEHLDWFRQYFAEKQQLLKEVNAIPADFDFNNTKLIDKQ